MSTGFGAIAAQAEAKSGTVSKTINGKAFTINRMSGLPGYMLGFKLMRQLLPAIGSVGDGVQNFEDIFPEDRSVFTQISVLLSSGLGNIDIEEVIRLLLGGATLDGVAINLDDPDFLRGDVASVAFLLEWALEVNYKDFFIVYIMERVTGIPAVIQNLMPRRTTSEESSET
jgi:hypothetical protein